MKIKEFLLSIGLREAEWYEWLNVKGSKGESQEVVVPDGPTDYFYHTRFVPAGADYVRKCELEQVMAEKITSALESGKWQVSARLGSPNTRQDLEEEDWVGGNFDFVGNRIGAYTHVRFRQSADGGRTDKLQNFIETLCKIVQPGTGLHKGVIEDLAEALCADQYQAKAFAQAWEKASIPPAYRKPGRRHPIENR